MIDLALQPHHALDRLLDLIDQSALDVLGELDLAEQLRQLDARAQRFPARPAILALLASRRALRGVLSSFSRHFSTCAQALRTASICRSTWRLRSSILSSVSSSSTNVTSSRMLRSSALSASPICMMVRAVVGVREIDLMTASLPRSIRLAISTSPSRVSERDRAHLAQVHANGVVGLVERARREVELEFFCPLARPVEQLVFAVGLLGIDDLDARAAERAEQIVQFVRRRDVSGQELVDFVVEQIALFFADGDELPHLVVFFFNRQRHFLLDSRVVYEEVRYPSAAIRCSAPVVHERLDALHQRFLSIPQRHDLVGVAVSRPAPAADRSPAVLRSVPCTYRRRFSARTQSTGLGGGVGLATDFLDQPGFSFI